MIKYSVIIPIYNGEKYLNECIVSVLNQIRDDVELILVNDGSTDNSLKICKQYTKKYNNIILIDKENTGSMDSWIKGVENSKGQYICFIDADDKIENNYFNSIDKYVDMGYDIVIYDFYKMFKNKILVSKVNNIKYGKIRDDYLKEIKSNYFENFEKYSLYRWNKVIKSDIIKQNIKKIKCRTVYMEDHPIEFLNLISANNIYYLDKTLYYYRIRGSSVTHKFNKKVLDDYFMIEKELNDIAKNNNYDKKQLYSLYLYFLFLYCRVVLKTTNNKREKKVKFKDILYIKGRNQKITLLLYKFKMYKVYNLLDKIKSDKNYNNLSEYFD